MLDSLEVTHEHAFPLKQYSETQLYLSNSGLQYSTAYGRHFDTLKSFRLLCPRGCRRCQLCRRPPWKPSRTQREASHYLSR